MADSKKLSWWKNKAAFEALCAASEAYGKMGGISKSMSQIMLFDWVEEIAIDRGEFEPNGWAVKFYEHFLYGHGRDVRFPLATLLFEDSAVRKTIAYKINAAIRQDPKLACKKWVTGGIASRLRPHPEMYAKDYKAPWEFAVSQKTDYLVSDWRNATGSFFIEWEAITSGIVLEESRGPLCGHKLGEDWIDDGTNILSRMRPPGPFGKSWMENGLPKFAAVWGMREYHWHPAEEVSDRADSCLHQAGYELNKTQLQTRNYWIYATPCVINLKTGLPGGSA